ncbi:MAG: NAD-dependent epimerase/dehydratase family protein [Chloroflexota bacterium]
MRVLVTGGAGFVGSHTVDALLDKGYTVRVYDNLDAQVHGPGAHVPAYLHPGAEFVWGDVRDRDKLKSALEDVDAVFHLAAAVGVGQSMYEVIKYVDVNSLGGAVLLDILANEKHSVRKVIVASSMSIYGEGQYHCERCGVVYPRLRPEAQLARREWEMRCPHCGQPVRAAPTAEEKPLFPTSVYAVTKRDHEELFLAVGRAYNLPTVALRYFNIYGSRQALSNPYTGVAAIFSSRLLNHRSPLIFEDGLQSRDFIHVSDIVQANLLALEKKEANDQVYNVGTGRPTSIIQVARLLGAILAPETGLEILGQYRAGDIRHCYADVGKIRQELGFAPRVRFEDGVRELLAWVATQQAEDLVDSATAQLIHMELVR